MNKKIARKDMLVSQKGFIDSCDIIRKAINKYKYQKTHKKPQHNNQHKLH
jgi:hypothetical protein